MGTKEKRKSVISAVTVRRGIWKSNPAYRAVFSAMYFPSFDIRVMNTYDELVAAGGATFWQMKATSNGSFFLFPKTDKKHVEVVSRNGTRARLSVEASGIVATWLALRTLGSHEAVVKARDRLLEYARQQPEFFCMSGFMTAGQYTAVSRVDGGIDGS